MGGNREDRRSGMQQFLDHTDQFKEHKLPVTCGKLTDLGMAYFKEISSTRNFNDWTGAELIKLSDLARIHERISFIWEKLRGGETTMWEIRTVDQKIEKAYRDELAFLYSRSDRIHGFCHLAIPNSVAESLKKVKNDFISEDDDRSLLFGDEVVSLPN